METIAGLRSAYVRLERILVQGRSPLLLLIRLYWGWQFFQSGWGKLFHLGHVTQYFSSLHVPVPSVMAPAIALLEAIGGVLLALGLGARGIALLLTGDMLVAYLLGDQEALKAIFSDPGKFYAADPFTFLAASLIVAVFGAGMFSLDYLIAGRREIAA